MSNKVRVGIVGAGANTRLRHVPGFRAIDGVELAGVVNSSAESTHRAAAEFDIPKTYPDWQALVADPDLDAVMIGTWPNLHCEVTCAALAAGKHVLTEARMARNLDEARRMLAAAKARPELVTQIVPSPFGLEHHDALSKLIADGFLGELRELVVITADDSFHDETKPLHWRQDREISGVNTLALGIIHEAATRWVPNPERVFAQTTIAGPTRPGPDGTPVEVTVPDSVQILTTIPTSTGSARGLYHVSGVALHGPGRAIHMYGSEGTIKILLGAKEEVWLGKAGEASLQRLDVPNEGKGCWRVEAEFIGAIRGEEAVRFTTFQAGVDYMAFTEAVARSAANAMPVRLGEL
jgi:predicted dehydrogenase